MNLIKTRFVELFVNQITPWELNPPERTSSNIGLMKLKTAIQTTRHVGALLVLHYRDNVANKFICVDGHRRLALMKELNISKVYCEVIDSDDIKIPLEEFFAYYNTSLKLGDMSRQYLYSITKNDKVLTQKQRIGLYYFMKAGGTELIDRIIKERKSLSALHSTALVVMGYCKKSYIQPAYALVFANWFLDNNEIGIKLKLLCERKMINNKEIWSAIENNKPITGK